MYEGVNNNQDSNPEEPFDYLAEAKRMREQREARDAAQKAEKDTKEKQKREERLAKQLARSVAKREEMAEKGKDLEVSSDKAKELVREVKKEVQNLNETADIDLPPPFVATMGEGSVVEMNVGQKTGEKDDEGLLLISHDIEKTEEAISLADEVSSQAQALARARDALLGVESKDMSTHSATDESGPVYDLGSEQQALRDRIQHTWDHGDAATDKEPVNDGDTPAEEVMPIALEVPSIDMVQSLASSSEALSSRLSDLTETYSAESGTIERSPDPISPVTSAVKSGVAFVGGFLGGRSRSSALKRSLDSTTSSLRTETAAIKRDVESIQLQSQTNEAIAPKQMEIPQTTFSAPSPRPEAAFQVAKGPEVHGTDAPAIPAWIKQVENDVKNGKVVELKKWQHDVLRIQHPDLLKQYEKLDGRIKEAIKHQSKEVLLNQFSVPSTPPPIPQPGDLPTPLPSMPAFMMDAPKRSPAPVFNYATTATSSASATTANGYLTIVIFGGIVFGAILIATFGF